MAKERGAYVNSEKDSDDTGPVETETMMTRKPLALDLLEISSNRFVAGVLRLEVEELEAAQADGQGLADIIEANDVDPQDIADSLIAMLANRLASRVTAGELTAEEAAIRLAVHTERLQDGFDTIRPTIGSSPGNSVRQATAEAAVDAPVHSVTGDRTSVMPERRAQPIRA